MPLTPLFPAKGTITINQGQAGSCYLLASLDCLLNFDPLARAKIESMFTQNADGSITVRFKRNPHYSNGLRKDDLIAKYIHAKDPTNGDDLITITPERLKYIDKNEKGHGVTSNSLAVKILERLASYYFPKLTEKDLLVPVPFDMTVSLGAFASPTRYQRSPVTPYIEGGTQSVSALLDIPVIPYTSSDFKKVLNLKTLLPDQVIYVQMRYGAPSPVDGTIHGGHALRVKSFTMLPNLYGKEPLYELVLVNPWNNQITERMCLTEAQILKDRQLIFSVYSTEPKKHELQMLLANMPAATGQYIIKNPDLFNRIATETVTIPNQLSYGFAAFLRKIDQYVEEHKRGHLLTSRLNKIKQEIEFAPRTTLDELKRLEAKTSELLIAYQSSTPEERKIIDLAFIKEHIIEPAIKLKIGSPLSRTKVMDAESSRRIMYTRLIIAHFETIRPVAFLTTSMNLNLLFNADVFQQKDIINLIPLSEQKLSFILAIMLSDDVRSRISPLTPSSFKSFLTTIRAEDIRDSDIDAILITDVSDIIAGINTIKSVAPTLHNALVEKIQNRLLARVQSKENDDLIIALNACPLFNFKQASYLALKELDSLSVDYSGIDSIKEIEAHQQRLNSQCDTQMLKAQVRNADYFLMCSGIPSIIQNKRSEITSKATLAKSAIEATKLDFPHELERLKRQVHSSTYKEKKALLNELCKLYDKHKQKMSADTFNDLILTSYAAMASASDAPKDQKQDRNSVQYTLLAYHFLGESTSFMVPEAILPFLTSSYPKSEIKHLFRPDELPAKIVLALINNPLLANYSKTTTNPELANYIRALQDNDINDEFIDNLLTQLDNPAAMVRFSELYRFNVRMFSVIADKLIASSSRADIKAFILKHKDSALFNFKERANALLKPITHFTIDFSGLITPFEIDRRKEQLTKQLNERAKHPGINRARIVLKDLGMAEDLLQNKLAAIDLQAQQKTNTLSALVNKAVSRDNDFITTIMRRARGDANLAELNATQFLVCLEKINLMIQKYATKKNPQYKEATETATKLYDKLVAKKNALVGGYTDDINAFCEQCLVDIKTARPVLEQHRGWKGTLKVIAEAIISIFEVCGIKSKKSNWEFFKPKTSSQQTVDNLENEVKKLIHK